MVETATTAARQNHLSLSNLKSENLKSDQDKQPNKCVKNAFFEV